MLLNDSYKWGTYIKFIMPQESTHKRKEKLFIEATWAKSLFSYGEKKS